MAYDTIVPIIGDLLDIALLGLNDETIRSQESENMLVQRPPRAPESKPIPKDIFRVSYPERIFAE